MIRLVFLFLFVGCSEPFYPLFQPDPENEISTIVFVLQNEVDHNGYLHLVHNPNYFQSLHRIKGHVYRDDKPMNVLKFGWYSDTYWTHDGYEIPVVNGSSYSREDGEVNTMMGIIPNMVDDTITVHYGWYDDWKSEEIYGRFDVIIH